MFEKDEESLILRASIPMVVFEVVPTGNRRLTAGDYCRDRQCGVGIEIVVFVPRIDYAAVNEVMYCGLAV